MMRGGIGIPRPVRMTSEAQDGGYCIVRKPCLLVVMQKPLAKKPKRLEMVLQYPLARKRGFPGQYHAEIVQRGKKSWREGRQDQLLKALSMPQPSSRKLYISPGGTGSAWLWQRTAEQPRPSQALQHRQNRSWTHPTRDCGGSSPVVGGRGEIQTPWWTRRAKVKARPDPHRGLKCQSLSVRTQALHYSA